MTSEQKKQYNKEVYEWRKAHHICVYCGKEDSAIGFVGCGVCLEKKTNAYHKNKEKYNQSIALKQKRYKEAGLCIVCGKPVSKNSKLHCDKHLEKRRLYDRKRYREKKVYVSIEREDELKKLREEALLKGRISALSSSKAQAHRKAYADRERKRIGLIFKKKAIE